jgi:hypothetical protein
MTSGQINVLFCIIPDNFNAACSFFVFLSIKYYILSTDMETAVKVGNRHGRPVVYQVNAGAMAKAGYRFYCSENNVWLIKRCLQNSLKKQNNSFFTGIMRRKK